MPPEELADAWRSYTQMRAHIGKPVSGGQAQLLLDELEKLEPGSRARQAQILNRFAMYGWQGLFPLPEGEPDEPPRSYDIDAMERRLWEAPIGEFKKADTLC